MNYENIQSKASNFRSIFDTYSGTLNDPYIYRANNLNKVVQFNQDTDRPLHIIDLRSNNELKNNPYEVKEVNVYYSHMPLYGEDESIGNSPETLSNINSLGEMYVYIYKNYQAVIPSILKFIMNLEGADVIFHCSAGKDRTGIVAMLLLEMLEIDRQTIIDSYTISAKNIYNESQTTIEKLSKEKGIEAPTFLFESNSSDIEHLYQCIESEYGAVHNYLKEYGISKEDMNNFQRKVKGE